MSIQTQIDRITGEVTTQKNKFESIESQLAEALALLDGKAAGGGGSTSGTLSNGHKVAIGTYEPASDEHMWGVDLDFTPTFVAVLGIADGTKIINPSGTGGVEEFTLLECEGTFNGQSYSYHAGLSPKSSTSVQYDIDDDFSEIYIDENRFDVLPGVAFFPLSKYLYIAIGESESGGSGGSAIETCTVTITGELSHVNEIAYTYELNGVIDSTGEFDVLPTAYTVIKGSIFAIRTSSGKYTVSGDKVYDILNAGSMYYCFRITDNCTLTVS